MSYVYNITYNYKGVNKKMKKISFDFDNTIAMSFMTYINEEPIPVFQSYNDKIIKKIKIFYQK